jgi:hypothetical protein
MAYFFSCALRFGFVFIASTVFGNENLLPISKKAFEAISHFIKYQDGQINFAEGATWPSACDGANNWVSSKKFGEIKNFYLRVSLECNLMLERMSTVKIREKITQIPLKITNPMQLKFDRTEIPSFGFEPNAMGDTAIGKANCNLKLVDYQQQVREISEKMALDNSYVPIQSTDGKTYYVQIMPLNDGQKKNEIEAAFAHIFKDKKKQSSASSDSSNAMTMSGIGREVALGAAGGVHNSTTCDAEQVAGSTAAQFCQAVVTNGVRVFLENKGRLNSTVAHVLGSSLFIPREILANRKPGINNLGVVNVNVFDELGVQVNQKVLGTVFGDGSFYLMWQKDLN